MYKKIKISCLYGKIKNTISKLGELQGTPKICGCIKKYTILGQFAAKFISIPPHIIGLNLTYLNARGAALWSRNKNVQRLASE